MVDIKLTANSSIKKNMTDTFIFFYSQLDQYFVSERQEDIEVIY